ncbi:Crp/Fnr family transcriptional regulator [Brevundimonas sp. NIBR11]|uniref:Crp/Fnr family transcriptional regulator n=1 Tax=Brevundimonas sp. NIBR11 TaxID=3015999 RepID=UPI0022F07928|nr:Crp/Fnr family transcriptional regulator [Brevundimonas sp. NIBR11]WGM30488.1 Nitrogen fixation regulation protein FixK [Brevundimonas sp. NIBR11]
MTPLTMKLEQCTALSEAERRRLDRLSEFPAKHFDAGDVILAEGQRVDRIHLVTDGFAARVKSLPDGLRQIVAFMIPGDLCDLEVFVLERMDHDIIAMAPTRCALIPMQEITELLTEVTTLTKALWWSTMTDLAVLRNRIVDQGRREAPERLAHLFYELLIRYRMIGMAADNSYPLPLSQTGLADAAGISPVHANRSLSLLRAERLVELDRGVVTVLNPAGLKRIAGFEAGYLHMARTEHPTNVSHRAEDLI